MSRRHLLDQTNSSQVLNEKWWMSSEDVWCTPLTQHICGYKVFIYFGKNRGYISRSYCSHISPIFFFNAGYRAFLNVTEMSPPCHCCFSDISSSDCPRSSHFIISCTGSLNVSLFFILCSCKKVNISTMFFLFKWLLHYSVVNTTCM